MLNGRLPNSKRRDFPIDHKTKDSACSLLLLVGGTDYDFDSRHVYRLVDDGKLDLHSGGVENFIAEHQANPDWRRGGDQRVLPGSGFLTINQAAAQLNVARSTMYYYSDKGLEITNCSGRAVVSQAAVDAFDLGSQSSKDCRLSGD